MNCRLLAVFAALLAGCAAPPAPPHGIDPSVSGPLTQGAERKKPPAPQLEQALIPPLRMEMPQAVTILRLDRNMSYILMPDQRMYMENPLDMSLVAQTSAKPTPFLMRSAASRRAAR